jgi:kumamolisin
MEETMKVQPKAAGSLPLAVHSYAHLSKRLGVHPYFKLRQPLPAATQRAPRAKSWNVPALCAAYNWPNGLPGGGVIAIVELGGGWTQSDMDTFFGGIGQPAPMVTDVSVDTTRNTPDTGPNSADGEVALDIQVAAAAYFAATGHQATIRVYWSQDIAAAVRAATADGCDVCSISWGSDEANWRAQSSRAGLDMELAATKATDAGMVVFAASGDNESSDGGPTRANVDLPAACPHIIGCGGTTKTDTTETVWNNNPGEASGEGTGGGFSTMFPMPPWQAGAPHGPGRMVPDVAANADPNTGYEIFLHGAPMVIGGTSAVAPLYAGFFASFGTKLGFVTPELWLNHLCFTDITDGDNGAFRARIGPDACTGLGSPIGMKLAQLLTHPGASAARRLREVSAENERLMNVLSSARTAAAVSAAAAADSTGCCTISAPGVPDRDIPGVTQAECDAIANSQPGAVAHWVKGSCA